MTAVLDLKGEHATNIRPAREAAGRLLWAKNPTTANDNNGTRLDATFINDMIGLVRGLFEEAGTTPVAGNDAAIAEAVVALVGVTAPAAHNHDDRYYTETEVDAIVAAVVAAVSGALVFKGAWDASSGSFPGAGAAQTGWFYKVSVAGTTGGQSFTVGDNLYAVADDASTSTYADNWLKIQGTITLAEVEAAVGFTFGSLAAASSIAAALISDSTAAGRGVLTAASYAAITALLSAMTGDSGSGGVKGLVPAPASGDAAGGKFLKADGTWAIPPGTGATFANQAEAEAGTEAAKATSPLTVKQGVLALFGHEVGQCYLSKVSTNLQLARYKGRKLFINGAFETIPATPITLSTSGLSTSTLYYIYAYMNAGTMTLEASATAPTEDSTYGHKIKTGDASRTLVGMARTNGSTAWVDSATQRFVLSYFNRRPLSLFNRFSTTRSTSSTSYVELNSEIRVEFLTWDDDPVASHLHAVCYNTGVVGATSIASVAFDGTTAAANGVQTMHLSTSNGGMTQLAQSLMTALAIGYHYATLIGYASAGTCQMTGAGNATDPSTSLALWVHG